MPDLPDDLVWLLEQERAAYAAGAWSPSTEPDCLCRHCRPPATEPGEGLGVYASAAEEFGAHYRAAQHSLALAWRAAAALHAQELAEHGPDAAEHVGSHLALLMGCTPARARRCAPRPCGRRTSCLGWASWSWQAG